MITKTDLDAVAPTPSQRNLSVEKQMKRGDPAAMLGPRTGAPGEAPMVRFSGVTKRYGALTVLDELDLEIARGEKVAIIGPSGSGKSTLLRVLMTLDPLTDGMIEVDGEPLMHMHKNGVLVPASLRHLRRVRSKIGMVFQNFNLFPHMTALENVMEGPVSVKQVPRAQARERALSLLERVGLQDRANAYPRQLSGGQKQRVAIARSLAMEPQVIFFDEPTSALDPELRDEVLNVMRELAQAGMTMLIVTHELKFARDVAHRILFMEGGQLLHDCPAEQFFADSNSDLRTRRFLGKLAV